MNNVTVRINDDNLSRPLLSVIIVVYNSVSTIKAAIDSVIGQSYGVELIVIDGGSSDGTRTIINLYDKNISYWVSEADKGIYDAMNKGVKAATGKWIYFLGADDQLMPDVLTTILPVLTSTRALLVCGSVIYDNQRVFRSKFSCKTSLQNTVHHQATFYNRILFKDFQYDSTIKVMADYELNLIIWKRKILTQEVDTIVALCASGGSSFNIDLSLRETNFIRRKHIHKLANAFLSSVLSLKYFIHYVLLRKV